MPECAGLGIDGDSAVVAHMFMCSGSYVEKRCLAAVGIAYECHIYGAPVAIEVVTTGIGVLVEGVGVCRGRIVISRYIFL